MKIGIDFVGISTPFYCHDGKGRLLMHKRTKACRDEHERWDTGAGKLEHGLSLEENVLKEVMEEYGCAGEIVGSVPAHDIFRTFDGAKTHWLAVPYFVRVDPAEVKINEPEKVSELGWFSIDALPEPLHTGFAYTFTRYRDLFEKYVKGA
jgi:8-oxo-dGTP pyrophosphatase MutT (NUDIX family)